MSTLAPSKLALPVIKGHYACKLPFKVRVTHTSKRLTVAGNLRSKQFQKLFLSSTTTTLVSQNSSDKREMPTPLLKSAS